MYKILVINPGSTSTKVAVFHDEKEVYQNTIRHKGGELSAFERITDQYDFRKNIIEREIAQQGIDLSDFDAIVGRGGMLKPLESGVYDVNEEMLHDLHNCIYSQPHPCNLGGIIADAIAKTTTKAIALIADPVVVDELQEVARVSGLPQMPRVSTFHALNQKAIARRFASEVGKRYEDLNLVVAHLGGGISVAAHKLGKVVDVNQALDGFGPFSPERSGTLPSGALVKMCFSGDYTQDEIKKLLVGQGGVHAHLGTNDMQEVVRRIKTGDTHAKIVLEAMAYSIAKEIGAMMAVLSGKADAILITGGIANNAFVINYILPLIENFAPVKVYPGEDEMIALALAGLRVLNGEQPSKYE